MIRLTRRAVRETLCEACGHRYLYLLTRSVDVRASWLDDLRYGSEGSSHVALHRANSQLERALATDSDPVPCPACGWYQADMLPKARGKRYGWLTFPTALLLLGGGTVLPGASVMIAAWRSSAETSLSELTALWAVWVTAFVVLVAGVVFFIRGLRRRRR